MAQQIVGTLCCFVFYIVVEPSDPCAGLAGTFLSKVLFDSETKDSEDGGETTAIQIRNHPSQQKFFELFGKLKLRPPFKVEHLIRLQRCSVFVRPVPWNEII